MLNAQERAIVKRAGDMVRKAEKERIDKIVSCSKEVANEFAKIYAEKTKEIKNTAAEEFYKYKPNKYQRRESLTNEDFLIIELGDNTFDYSFNSDMVVYPSRSKRSESGSSDDEWSLYDLVWRKGYHGGASSISKDKENTWGRHPDGKTPYWRGPGYILDPDTNKPYLHLYGRWMYETSGAYKEETPPLELFRSLLSKYEDDEAPDILRSMLNKRYKKEGLDMVV